MDQFELIRRADEEVAGGGRVQPALEYLKAHVRKIHWTEAEAKFRLTEELLKKQLGLYYAAVDLIEEYRYDFCGIKGQRELTEHYATADVAEAFLNDPYGPDGAAKPSVVCATEADCDAALTMQIFKHLAETPVLFADVRHLHEDLDFWDLCNSGEHATYFAARSFQPEVNLARTEFRPQGFYFPAGGASVYHLAAPGPFTLGRLTRRDGRYQMTALSAELVDLGERGEEVAALTQDNWPHACSTATGTILWSTSTAITSTACTGTISPSWRWCAGLWGLIFTSSATAILWSTSTVELSLRAGAGVLDSGD